LRDFTDFDLFPVIDDVTPRKYIRFGLVRDRDGNNASIAHSFFDQLRYDSCFLARQTDAEWLIERIQEGDALAEGVIGIGKFCFSKNEWSFSERWQGCGFQVEELNDAALCEQRNVTSWELAEKQKIAGGGLKCASVLDVTATPDRIVNLMFSNHAFPSRERDSNKLERSFYRPEELIEIQLKTFVPKLRIEQRSATIWKESLLVLHD